VTLGLRAGELIAVTGVTAVDNQAEALAGDNGIEQTRIRTTSDLRLMVAHFTSKGTEEETHSFLETIAACIPGPLPPMTVVP